MRAIASLPIERFQSSLRMNHSYEISVSVAQQWCDEADVASLTGDADPADTLGRDFLE